MSISLRSTKRVVNNYERVLLMSPTCECYKPTDDVSVAINIVTDYTYFVTTV